MALLAPIDIKLTPPPPPPLPPPPPETTNPPVVTNGAQPPAAPEPAASPADGSGTDLLGSGDQGPGSASDLVPADGATSPKEAIGKLNSDGDEVVLSLTAEGKLVVPVPVPDLAGNVKGQYGFDVTVKQVGGAPPPGDAAPGTKADEPPTYEVTFNKDLLGGIGVEPGIPFVDPAFEQNLTTADTVTMSFKTQEEAARAVEILGRVAAEESVRDAGKLVAPEVSASNPATNPLLDTGASGDLPGVPLTPYGPVVSAGVDAAADRIGPSAEDRKFLTDHITGYSTTLGAHQRARLAASLGQFGIEPRLDSFQQVTRTVELPKDGEPARITYSFAGEMDANAKEKFTIGKKDFDFLEVGYTPQNIVDIANMRSELSLTWEVDPATFDAASTVSGHTVPETGIVSGDLPARMPDEISAKVEVQHTTQSPLNLSRTDLHRYTVEATVKNPREHVGDAMVGLAQGDLRTAFNRMGEDAAVTVTDETIARDGIKQQHEAGFEIADLFEGKVSLIAEYGINDITNRTSVTTTGTRTGQEGTDAVEVDPNQPPDGTTPGQLVVVPRDGLTVRETPAGEREAVFQHGSFVQPTGNTATDTQGRQWVEVAGPDHRDRPVTGWVAAEHVRPHETGAMDGTGRTDPALESRGYREIRVKEGDNLWDLAQANGVEFRDMVELNGGHLIDPSLIFPGDTVYVPGTGKPAAEPEPQPEQPQTEPPQGQPTGSTPSSPSQPGSDSSASGETGVPGQPVPERPVPEQPTPDRKPETDRPADGRRDPAEIQRTYQVGEESLTDWSPSIGPFEVPGFIVEPRQVTQAEATLLDRLSPGELSRLDGHRRAANETGDRLFPPNAPVPEGIPADRSKEWQRNDGHNDAARHAYFSAVMTRDFGEGFAREFGTAHEARPGNPADREAMDLYNNEVGRRIALEHPGASDEELAGHVRQAAENGELLVIDGNGNLAWSDQVAYGRHGLQNDPAIPGGPKAEAGARPDSSPS